MLKSELIAKMAINEKLSHLPEKDIADSINLLLDHICAHARDGKRIEIRKFGSFSRRYCKPRKARNPSNGENLVKEAKYKLHFKPGLELRQKVNSKTE
ncbi:MAG: HU family DNA-binding protein [Gammaproteobacteria bacterium]